jgi:hypothetical protein
MIIIKKKKVDICLNEGGSREQMKEIINGQWRLLGVIDIFTTCVW